MTKTQPAVSIVMPIYNASSYLHEALDSAVGQALANIEIVAVNDGSTDDSLDIIRDYAARDPRVTVVDGPNGGYGKAMNRGIDAATGDYVGILEPDDHLELTMYEKLYATAEADALDFVRSDYRYFATGADGKRVSAVRTVAQEGQYGRPLDPQTDRSLFRNRMENWTGIYRRSFLNEHDIRFSETPGASFQDNGFWFQTYSWASRIAYVHEPFYCYRVDNSGSSINNPDKAFAMLDEYAIMHTWLSRHVRRDLPEDLVPLLFWAKVQNCRFAISRLNPTLQLSFAERFSQECRDAATLGEIDRSLFDAVEWHTLRLLMRDPHAYWERLQAQPHVDDFAFDQDVRGTDTPSLRDQLAFHLRYDSLVPTASIMANKVKTLFNRR